MKILFEVKKHLIHGLANHQHFKYFIKNSDLF